MKTYVITLSRTFPAKHPRKGEPTNFDYQVLNAVWRSHNMSIVLPQYGMKLHTIRANYELWSKRFKQIDDGKAAYLYAIGLVNRTTQSRWRYAN